MFISTMDVPEDFAQERTSVLNMILYSCAVAACRFYLNWQFLTCKLAENYWHQGQQCAWGIIRLRMPSTSFFSKVEDNLSYALPNGDPRHITSSRKEKKHQINIHVNWLPNVNARLIFFSKKNIYKVCNFAYTITKQRFLMSSREVTKTQKYLKLFKV